MADDDWGNSSDYWGGQDDSSPQQNQQQQAPSTGIPVGVQLPQQEQMPAFNPNQGADAFGGQQSNPQGFGINGGNLQGQGFGVNGSNNQNQSQQPPKKPSDKKGILIFVEIILILMLIGVGAVAFNKARSNNASISNSSATSSQSTTNNSQKKQSQQTTPKEQGNTGDSQDSSKYNNSNQNSDNSSNGQWDSSSGATTEGTDSGKSLNEVGSLPNVSKEGSSGGIVANKHVYAEGDAYLYSLEISLSTGEKKTVEFFVSKDSFDKINTGSIVTVKYIQYSDGKVGLTSVESGYGSN